MGSVVGPNSSRSSDHGRGNATSSLRAFFASLFQIVRQYGLKGLVALVVAALFAFAPLTLLYWFNEYRLASVVTFAPQHRVVVKPARHQQDQDQEEPGETALLQVICETTSLNETRQLLIDDDPRRDRDGQQGASFVRREMVYLRPAGFDPSPPFALLGKPPVSVWLPAGDYQILVVHAAPRTEQRIDARSNSFPLVSVFAECSLEKRRKTVCRVSLPHFDWGLGTAIELVEADGSSADRAPRDSELTSLLAACESVMALPTPGGYVLALDEPSIHHDDEHRRCTMNFADQQAVPREWTRQQLATLRNWLPESATAARTRLESLVEALAWREFWEGWYCYAAAGIAGLVFTRWGALAMLEPWRRGESFGESLGLLAKIFFLSVAGWFVFHMLSD